MPCSGNNAGSEYLKGCLTKEEADFSMAFFEDTTFSVGVTGRSFTPTKSRSTTVPL